MTWKKLAVIGIAAGALALGGSGKAQADLVTNGGFETTTGLAGGQLGYNTNATGWSTSGYNFLFNPAATTSGTNADNGGVVGSDGSLQLWGPGNGSPNGLMLSPDGGNFVAADGAYEVGAISQTINGLTNGDSYVLSFYWGGAQQAGVNFTAPTTEQWQVSFGTETQSTAVLNNAGMGFTGWMSQSFTFTADGSSDVLSFLAVGTPSVPPFVLLDGVTLNSVPEPTSILLTSIGVIGLGGVYVRRRRRAKAKAAAV